jgi:predicted NUDIX family NTP pyrophosphohydrolase
MVGKSIALRFKVVLNVPERCSKMRAGRVSHGKRHGMVKVTYHNLVWTIHPSNPFWVGHKIGLWVIDQ